MSENVEEYIDLCERSDEAERKGELEWADLLFSQMDSLWRRLDESERAEVREQGYA